MIPRTVTEPLAEHFTSLVFTSATRESSPWVPLFVVKMLKCERKTPTGVLIGKRPGGQREQDIMSIRASALILRLAVESVL